MGAFSRTLARVLLAVLVVPSMLSAASRISFKQNEFQFTAQAGNAFSIDLKSLLSDLGNERVWSHDADKPAWLILDQGNERLSGVPKFEDVGKKSFFLSVQDGDAGARTKITITVEGAPRWRSGRIDLGIAKEDFPFSFDLNPHVDNPSGAPVTFSAKSLPHWLKISPDGILSGTPDRPAVGDYKGVELTVTSAGGSDRAEGYGTVLKTPKPPQWLAETFRIGDATEDKPYAQETNLPQFVSNPESIALTFRITTSNAPWLQITPSGSLHGTPGKNDLKPVTVVVELSGRLGEHTIRDTASFQFNVIHVNHAPKWLKKEIVLPPAFTGVAYQQLLSSSAEDPDAGDTLTFEILSDKKWAQLSLNGVFTGTPDKPHVGENRWQVRVKDQDGLSDEATVVVQVIKSNEPPFWINKPTVLPKAKEDFPYSERLANHATDPDNDPLTFTIVEGPAWATISSSGFLVGTPGKNDVGLQKFKIRVSDGQPGHNDVTEALLEVEHTNHPPKWVLEPVFQVKEDSKMLEDLSRFVTDPDTGDTLSFQIISGPPTGWATLSMDGKRFEGTPRAPDVGENRFTVRVTDQAGASSDGIVIVNVIHVNHKPTWLQDPIVLPNAREKVPYLAGVSTFAKDPDTGDTLTFSKVGSGAPWLTVQPSGAVQGTPARAHVGLNVFQVRVTDQNNEFAVVTVHVTVEKVNNPPRWRMDPVLLDDAFEDLAYNFDLSLYAVDDDGDKLTFKKREGVGPEWMFVGADGKITGLPLKKHLGDYTTIFVVSDGQAEAEAGGKGKVLPRNHPPIIKPEIAFIVKERETRVVELNDPQYIEDLDGDKLNCTLFTKADWVELTKECRLTMRPRFEHIGSHTFKFRVDDGELFTDGQFVVTVIRDPRPPIWKQDPIRLEARTNEPFKHCVGHLAQDLDGLPLTFSCEAQPGFVGCSTDGCLQGKPASSDEGEHSFRIIAKNDKLGAPAVIILKVVPGTEKEQIQVDKPVVGARTENLWVVDSSPWNHDLKERIKAGIKTYFTLLDQAKIRHSGVMLSPDYDTWKGTPVASQGNYLFKWDAANVTSEFVKRVDLGYSNNCYNTPIWSMFKFLEKAGTIPHINPPNPYFEAKVPYETMYVTNQLDHFKRYTPGTAQAGWNANDFADHFINALLQKEKTLRVSAIAPHCPSLMETSGEGWTAAPANAYGTIVTRTGGTYYPLTCPFDLGKVLKDYAEKVIFRAYVLAKHSIKLSKTPLQPNNITVTIGGRVLPGNTGSPDDKWTYDSATNSVNIFWNRIDLSQVKPGDVIEIEYRVS